MPRLGILASTISLSVALATAGHSQSDASIEAGLGTVRFPGGATSGVFAFSPAFSLVGASRQFSLSGTVAAVPQSGGYGQGRLATWITTPALAERWRLATDIELSGTTLGTGDGSGAGSITAELLYATSRWGVGAGGGPSSGWITAAAPVTALHTRLRAWWHNGPGALAVSGSVEPTRFLGSWFTDVDGGVTVRSGRVTAQVTTSNRVSAVYGSKSAAIGLLGIRVTRFLSLEFAGGNVLPDPYEGFPASGFVMAGARIHLPLHRVPARYTVQASGFSMTTRAEGITLRLQRHGVANVAVAGDWNDWTPSPLMATQLDAWEIRLHLRPGVYHFTLMVDGVEWTIPAGVPSIPDGLGGRVAVLTVTP